MNNNFKKMFPLLNKKIGNKRIIYLDNASTTQKPNIVIDRVVEYYKHQNANIDRGWHSMGTKSSVVIESSRNASAQFINAHSAKEINFTYGTTDAINTICFSVGDEIINEGDSVLISEIEHHANILPWLHLCKKKNAHLIHSPITTDCDIDIDRFKSLLAEKKPKIVSLNYISNVTGSISPMKELTKLAKKAGALVLVDAAQAAPHIAIDVKDIGCDFLVFSSHKMYGPTGTGVLYSKNSLDHYFPYRLGGGIVKSVKYDCVELLKSPNRFEAGTLNLAGIAGHEAAINFITNIGIDIIYDHDQFLLGLLESRLRDIDEVEIVGNPKYRSGVLSFIVKGINFLDIAMYLDSHGVIVRAGNLCAQPLLDKLGLPGVVRASLGIYNTERDIYDFVKNFKSVIQKLKNV